MTGLEMSTPSKDILFMILQFLYEEGLKEAAHELERESGLYFNMKFFEEMVLGGNWKGAERYLSGFKKLDDDRYSMKMYFEIRKHKFLEELEKNNRVRALDILLRDVQVFAKDHKELYKEMTRLLTLNNIREHKSLSLYGDPDSARETLACDLKEVIEADPFFCEKLKFPTIENHGLRCLVDQSLNQQHIPGTNPWAPEGTRSMDDVCVYLRDHLRSLLAHTDINPPPSQPTSIPVPTSSADATADTMKDDNVVVLPRPSETFDEDTSFVALSNQNVPNIPDENPGKNNTHKSCEKNSDIDVPKVIVRTLYDESYPSSMEFHPSQQTILLVGTNTGAISLWDAISGEKLLLKNFIVWNTAACSKEFKILLRKDPIMSVNRIAWSPDGSLFGAAYSKHLLQMHSYHGLDGVRQQLEIDAHVGGVNDLAFSAPHVQLLVLTCGDDKIIKAWDANNGAKIYTFEGHTDPVYSLLVNSHKNHHVFISTSVDGNIKGWHYDTMRAVFDYDATSLGHTSMAYCADRRLFLCSTNEFGDPFLFEWDEKDGSIKRVYEGLQKNSSGLVPFDTMKDRFLAAGDEHLIKIWDIDDIELLATINIDGSLPENPLIRSNEESSLMAVFAGEGSIKILASDHGLQLLHKSENCSVDDSRIFSSPSKKRDTKNSELECRNARETDVTEASELFEITSPSQCRTLWLPYDMKAKKISRIVYAFGGKAILALASNGAHLLWKWPLCETNVRIQATMEITPQLWLPKHCLGQMMNDVNGINPEEAAPCFALTNTHSFLMSASGGKISLFNMTTFETMLSMMPSPPATTCLAFYPRDNNIIAIGRDDSTILIYAVHLSKVISKLEGHSKRVCSLAFSNDLNLLVSSGADARISVWDAEEWTKTTSIILGFPDWKKFDIESPVKLRLCCYTHVEFHQDQRCFLSVQERHLAIYEVNGRQLSCVKEWIPGDIGLISHATFSGDSQMIYACFKNGAVSIFDTLNLELQRWIDSAAYLPSCSRLRVYPLAIAAHPHDPNQFAMGLTDGRVIVVEPPKRTGKWSLLPPSENGSVSNDMSR